jgi:hypothetical protein
MDCIQKGGSMQIFYSSETTSTPNVRIYLIDIRLWQKQQFDNYSHLWLYRMHFAICIFVVIYFVFMSCLMCTLACKGHPTVTTSLNYKFYILFCRLFLRLYSLILCLFLFCSVTTCDEMKIKAYRFSHFTVDYLVYVY